MKDYFASNAPAVLALNRAFNEQLAGIAPPVMFPPADPERLHDITPAPWDSGRNGQEL